MKSTNNAAKTQDENLKAENKDAKNTLSNKENLLEKLFVNLLKDMFWAEDYLLSSLKDMKKAATTHELQDAFEDHIFETQKHKVRLENVFELIGEKAEAKKCEVMVGLAKEAENLINETEDGTMTRDAALIIAAQKIEHYEIATYGSLVQLARTLGHNRAADLMEKTLWEEEDNDKTLTSIAENHINPMADNEDEEVLAGNL